MNLIILFSFLLNFNNSIAINDNPVKWDFSIEKDGNELFFVATARMDKLWVLYSQDNDGEGPIPTYFEFSDNENIRFIEENVVEYGDVISEFDELFETQVKKYKHEVVFKRKFTSKNKTGNIMGFVEFMTCDGQRCLPPTEIPFKVSF